MEQVEGSYEGYIRGFSELSGDLSADIGDLYSEDTERVLNGVKTIRNILSKTNIIDEIIDLGLLPKLVDCLRSSHSKLQFEASWVMTNMAVGTTVQTRYLIEAGGVEALVRLLSSDSEESRVQAAWALGNMAGDHDHFRGVIIQSGAIPGVIHTLRSASKDSSLLKGSWVLENLCLGNRDPYRLIQILPVLQDLLVHSNDKVVLQSLKILTTLSFHTQVVQELFNLNLVSKIEDILNAEGEMCTFALQIIGNIFNANVDNYTNKLLGNGFLNYMERLLYCEDILVIRQLCQIIKNITRGNNDYMKQIFDKDIIPSLWETSRKREDEKAEAHITGAILNILNKGKRDNVRYILDCGMVKEFCKVLSTDHDAVFHDTLSCLEVLLSFEEGESQESLSLNRIGKEIEECGGLDCLEKLLSHQSEKVYRKAFEIIQSYYSEDDDDHPCRTPLEESYNHFVARSKV